MIRAKTIQSSALNAVAFLRRGSLPVSRVSGHDSILHIASRSESTYTRDPKYAKVTESDVAAFKKIVGAVHVLQDVYMLTIKTLASPCSQLSPHSSPF